MASLSYFPVVDLEHHLIDIISRAAWFLSPFEIDQVFIPIAQKDLESVAWRVAEGMDDAISGRFEALRKKVVFVTANRESDIEACMSQADILLYWKEAAIPKFVSPDTLTRWERGKRIARVDPIAIRQEGSHYIDIGFWLADKRALIADNSLKFRKLASTLGRFEQAYVLATGPSIANYRRYDYSNALTIVCNSVINDDELMDFVQPQILVFADPIFHFGPSQYAAKFRATLARSAEKYDYTICIPIKYYPLFTAVMPELAERTIAIPFLKDRKFNFDLNKEFEVKTTANILTFLMVPLASTFAERIGFLGCDGRPLIENTYFWGHHSNVQFNDKMANIRAVHPGFFNIDYNDYYLEHCQTLEAQLADGEAIGKKFISLGFSHIPALSKRSAGVGKSSSGSHRSEHDKSSASPIDATYPRHTSMASHELAPQELPRLLVVDLTNMGLYAATSRIKEAFFGTWPDEKFRLVCLDVEGAKRRLIMADKQGRSLSDGQEASLIEEINAYRPEVIYYRAVDNPLIHRFACALLSQSNAPLVIHIMDDWPARLEYSDAEMFREFDKSLREMFERATYRLSISEKMSQAFEQRYGHKFLPFANGIDPADFPEKVKTNSAGRPFLIRYTGALAEDMTFGSICDVAEAIEDISKVRECCFEIFTREPWLSLAKKRFSGLSRVSVKHQVPADQYNALLQSADALLIAYNFDERSKRYVGYSLANKLPEYLASGTPVIAYGPAGCATIEYLRERGCAHVISDKDFGLLKQEIQRLIQSHQLQTELGETGRRIAFKYHNVWEIQRNFHRLIVNAAREGKQTLLGPYSRSDLAHLDETRAVAQVFSGHMAGSTMIDVGAHQGSALMPFLNMGWSIYAFEPDDNNRTNLIRKLSGHDKAHQVILDNRCVGNKTQQGVTFFTSNQSTGISGLSAFHPSHKEAYKVDVITLRDYFAGKEMPKVDFLKVDTEGYDLFVLQGYPWERGKPVIIECEFENAKTTPLGYSFHDIARFLVEKGYAVYVSEWHPIVRYGARHNWRRLARYPCELIDTNGWGNLIAFLDQIDEGTLIEAIKNVLKVDGRRHARREERLHKQTVHHSQSLNFEFHPSFKKVGQHQWFYKHSDGKQNLWIAYINVEASTAGKEYAGTVSIRSNRPVMLHVTMGRYGQTVYEGSSQKILLECDTEKTVRITKRFTQNHSALKLQIEVLGIEGGDDVLMTIGSCTISEVEPPVSEINTEKNNISLREANRLLRTGDTARALEMYLALYERIPLRIYESNAMFAARKMGISAATLEAVRQHVSKRNQQGM